MTTLAQASRWVPSSSHTWTLPMESRIAWATCTNVIRWSTWSCPSIMECSLISRTVSLSTALHRHPAVVPLEGLRWIGSSYKKPLASNSTSFRSALTLPLHRSQWRTATFKVTTRLMKVSVYSQSTTKTQAKARLTAVALIKDSTSSNAKQLGPLAMATWMRDRLCSAQRGSLRAPRPSDHRKASAVVLS